MGSDGGDGGPAVDWRDWGPRAFAAARRADDPILLSLTAVWCDDCHEMDATTYAEPRVVAAIADGVVPVRVDVDRHPRVRERYNAGGFPTTAFLAPDGRLLTAAGYLGPDGMRAALRGVRRRYDERGPDGARVPRALADEAPPGGAVTPRIEAHLAGQLEAQYDPEFGGWGTDAKFPLPRTVEFALKRDRERAVGTLAAISESLADADGGFFRYARARDWSRPAREKLAAPNAALLRAFAHAYCDTGAERFREPAAASVGFLTDDLWTGRGVGGSRAPGHDPGSRDGDRDGDDDEPATAVRRDRTVYAGPNAAAADALLAYHAYTDDDRAREYAGRILGTLRRELIGGPGDPDGDPAGGVVARYRTADDGGESDLLADCAAVVAAFTRARQVLGGDRHLTVARAVADRAVDRLRDGNGDGDGDGDGPGRAFRDGPASGPGLLDRPLRPLDGNAEMAVALCGLAAVTGADRYRTVAREAVAAFAGATERMGVQAAVYGTAASLALRGPLVVAVGTPAGTDLHRAALRIADHEAVVVPDAAAAGHDVDAGAAVAVADGRRSEPAATPDELTARVAAVTDAD